ncbi:hypothetical protein C1I95_08955 [Micromonospora craterilacus]|uniref:Uncharacterized protein n=1 Tax=Micromonospora craterilacus TaxID=1655439 RepID=A0A2W2G1M0_9ACTN|nr:hypothetical protein C1I95_08955 [Micromonospora craterilacus]
MRYARPAGCWTWSPRSRATARPPSPAAASPDPAGPARIRSSGGCCGARRRGARGRGRPRRSPSQSR